MFAASRGGWAIRQERAAGINTTTGEPLIWFLSIAPVIATFLVLDIAWGVTILARRQWKGGQLWLLSALMWTVAAAIDFAHH